MFISGKQSAVWNEILTMPDPVHVNYICLEELFMQKTKDEGAQKQVKKKEPTEVCGACINITTITFSIVV